MKKANCGIRLPNEWFVVEAAFQPGNQMAERKKADCGAIIK